MNDIVWEADVECTSCGGTGLYVGMAEKKGAAVVCSHCDGTGKYHVKHEYTSFSVRKESKGVKRVFKTAAGYMLAAEDVVVREGNRVGETLHFTEGGASYKDWKNGAELLPVKDLHCPLEHYQQGTDEGEWLKAKGPCEKHLSNYIPDCSRKNREACWILHDAGVFKWKK